MRKAITVHALAREAEMDVDTALVTLWDTGIEAPTGPADVIALSDITKARRALGLADPRQLVRPSYWQSALNLDEASFIELLIKLGIRWSPVARNLPKGAIRKLEQHRRGLVTPLIPRPRQPLLVEVTPPEPTFEWKTIGRTRTLRFLNTTELLAIHDALVVDFSGSSDPIKPAGTRSMDLLESAAMRPTTSLGGIDKYPTVEMAAAALLHSIIHNHPFHNGNKRSALVAMLVFLDENDHTLTCEEDELFKFVIRVAQHLVPESWRDRSDRETSQIAEWVQRNARLINHSEKPLKWHKLRRILADHGCDLNQSHTTMKITRTLPKRRLFKRTQLLFASAPYGGDGKEVDRDTIRRIRRNLQLDEENGVDSEDFYAGRAAPEAFINQYRKTLRRLAKL